MAAIYSLKYSMGYNIDTFFLKRNCHLRNVLWGWSEVLDIHTVVAKTSIGPLPLSDDKMVKKVLL